MVTKTISVEDIKNIAERRVTATVPDYAAAVSIRNLVSYCRKAYPLATGETYVTNTVKEDNSDRWTITISVKREEDEC